MSLTNYKTLLLQTALEQLGHHPGPIDGLWGRKTDAAYAQSGKGKTWLIQLALKSRGIDPGPHDGAWGPLTAAAVSRGYLMESRSVATRTAGTLLAEIARGEVGVREVGNNGGARVREYQAATWLVPAPWPWCAALVCWVFREAQGLSMPLAAIPRPRTAGAWDFENWARQQRTHGVRLIKPLVGEILAGDILVYTFSHIGIAASGAPATASRVQTVEGNTNAGGAREGDGVYLRDRARSQIRSVIRVL